jgi:hypothetical protein
MYSSLPTFDPTAQVKIAPAKCTIVGPMVGAVPHGTDVKIFDSVANGGNFPFRLIVQNTSTQALKWAINTVAGTNEFHGILAADTGTDAGKGGILVLSDMAIKELHLFADGGTDGRYSLLVALRAEDIL